MTVELEPRHPAPLGRKLTSGIVVFDGSGNIIEWSTEALRLHGYADVAEVRRNISTFSSTFALYTPDDQVVRYEDWPVARLMRGEAVDNLELRLRRLDTGQNWFVSYSGLRLDVPGSTPLIYLLLLQDVTDWHRTDTALRDSQIRLSGVVETAGDGILTLDEEGTIETANPAMFEIFGYAEDTLVGQPVSAVMPEFSFEQLQRIARANGARGLESVGRRADGSTFTIEVSISEMRLAGRRHFTLIVRSIVARKEFERKLHDKNTLMRTLIEGITDPLYVTNADGRFRYVNAAMARRAGRLPEECIGLDLAELFGPVASAAMHAIDRRVLESPNPVTYEETLQTGENPSHFLVTKLAFRDADGAPAGIVGFSRDITSLKRAEHALRESERHVRDIMNSLPVAIVVLAADGNVSETNAIARDMLAPRGITGTSVPGLPWTGLPWATTLETQAQLGSALARAVGGEISHLSNMPTGAGKSVFDLVLAPMRDAKGLIGHVILSAIDVSERRAAEALARDQQMELAHLERVQTMGHMASGLAHELNQPLGSIVNYAGAARQLLAAKSLDAPNLDLILKEVISETSRAGEIIRRLRKFVEKQRPQVQPTEITTLINDALRILAFETRRIGVTPTVYFAPDLPFVAADAVQIGQVLVNLVRNAVDAMQEVPLANRSLKVGADLDANGNVSVFVADSGPGSSDQNLERLFNAFYTTKSQGLGMGLALCRMIIEDHGGQIWAEKNSPQGLQFSFTLRSVSETKENNERGRTEGVSGR